MEPLIRRAQLSREEWLEGLARICLADARKMFDSSGNRLAVTELGPNEAAAIMAFEVFSRTESSDEPQARSRTARLRMIDQLRRSNYMERRWDTLLSIGRSQAFRARRHLLG